MRAPRRVARFRASTSPVPSTATSFSARRTRARAVAPHTSDVAPKAATVAPETITAAERRDTASDPTARIQRTVYHHGHWPGAPHTTGASTAANTASAGATTGDRPRDGPSAALPAAAPESRTAVAARHSGTSHTNQSVAFAPNVGIWMPRAKSRNRNGPSPATSKTIVTATQLLA